MKILKQCKIFAPIVAATLILAFDTFQCHAQSSVITYAIASMDPVGLGDSVVGSYIIELSDTINIDQIEIKLGTDQSLSDVYLYTFPLDNISALPPSFTYSRRQLRITLTLGTYLKSGSYYGEARLKDTGGGWSQPHFFVSN